MGWVSSTKAKLAVAAVIFFILGTANGIRIKSLTSSDTGHHCIDDADKLINCEIVEHGRPIISKSEYITLKTKLERYIQDRSKSGEIDSAAVFFRDLKSGPTMGVNADERFIPASLLKVPLLLTYLRLAETNPDILKKELAYRGKATTTVTSQQFLPHEQIKPNLPYTIDELLRRTIVYSDNKAYEGLINYLKTISPEKDLLADTIIDLGVVNPASPDNQIITVKSYASIFRLLYNVSFLETKEMSAKALSYLVDAEFPYGIIAGVPKNLKVANKFGERAFLNSPMKQLHDCGIVYYPGNPYLICVMTRGTDYIKQSDAIKTISQMVYEEVDSRRIMRH
jgi:beta-lactamase class A